MNSKNNLRFQETERKIRDIFSELLKKKELSKITVREICSLADINRTTFYLHHEDIYELMQCIESDMYHYFKIIFTFPGKNYCLRDRFLHLFSFIRENQDFYRVYLSSQRRPSIFDYALLPESDMRIQKFMRQSDINKLVRIRILPDIFPCRADRFPAKMAEQRLPGTGRRASPYSDQAVFVQPAAFVTFTLSILRRGITAPAMLLFSHIVLPC